MGRPSDLPGDQTTLKVSVTAAIISHILAINLMTGGQWVVAPAVLDAIVAGTCLFTALHWRGIAERFVQAFSAYCGVSVVLNLASIPMLGLFSGTVSAENVTTVQMAAQFAYMVWGISALAHIVRFTFDVSLAVSIGVSTGFLFLNLFLVDTFFPM